MRKRAGFARALVFDPAIVMFDEPDSGLDPVRTALLCELIREVHEEHGGCYLVISHDPGTGKARRRLRGAVEGQDRRERTAGGAVQLGQRVRPPVLNAETRPPRHGLAGGCKASPALVRSQASLFAAWRRRAHPDLTLSA